MSFPQTRLRRLRRTPALRRLLTETRLSADQLVWPVFVRPGRGAREPISSMPGQYRYSVDTLLKEAEAGRRLGISSLLLFGLPARKDPQGREAWSRTGIVQQAVRALKKNLPDLALITDLCFCGYTSHGHCGVLRSSEVDNDATLKLLGQAAVAQAEAGADLVAPSGMMDGMVLAIRDALDRRGFQNAGILSYSAKYASAFYGPFRDAAHSAPGFGDRKGYQMNPANSDEALREIQQDLQEGADIVMVKPALPYLDIIRRVKDSFQVPVAAYNVSGEYAMLKAASRQGWLEEGPAILETLTALRRAGADILITYHAREAARLIQKSAPGTV